jgi:inosose dehydratase
MQRNIGRISYMHFKDVDPKVKADVIANRHRVLRGLRAGHLLQSRATGMSISPPCGRSFSTTGSKAGARSSRIAIPTLDVSPIDDARANRDYLESIGFLGKDQWHD